MTPAADASPAVTAAPAAAVEAVPEAAVPEQIEESADQSLFNRLAYDASQPEALRKTWTIAGPDAGSPLRNSGLLGPVRLLY